MRENTINVNTKRIIIGRRRADAASNGKTNNEYVMPLIGANEHGEDIEWGVDDDAATADEGF